MMDLFYNSLPFAHKKRMHFHSFMRWFHQQLKQHKGHKNPIALVAKDFAQSTCVLCFDEFYVTDITNAMLLGQLLQALIKANIAIIITSNIPANQLYRLPASKFLSTIAMIKQIGDLFSTQERLSTQYQTQSLSLFFPPESNRLQSTPGHMVRKQYALNPRGKNDCR